MNFEAILNLIFIVGALSIALVIGLKKTKSVKSGVILFLLFSIPIIIFIFGFISPASIFSREVLQSFVKKFGLASVAVLLVLQIVQVVIPPLDHNVVGMIGGYLFGPWLGFIYNFTGRVAGSLIAFFLARKLGRSFIEKKIAREEIHKYDRIWNKTLLYVFLGYWAPFFPDDTISYLAGTARVNLRTFLIILLLGHPTGTLGISFTGSLGMTKWIKNPYVWVISASTLVLGLLIFGIAKIRGRLLSTQSGSQSVKH